MDASERESDGRRGFLSTLRARRFATTKTTLGSAVSQHVGGGEPGQPWPPPRGDSAKSPSHSGPLAGAHLSLDPRPFIRPVSPANPS